MRFENCFAGNSTILMEGALGERLKREFGLRFHNRLDMARMIYDPRGAAALKELWGQYIRIAKAYQLPFLATTPTRRANRERICLSGETEQVILDNVSFLRNIQENSGIEMYIGGLMGCRGDAYSGAMAMQEESALAFHGWAADCFRRAGVDFLYAGIMPTLPEAAGMARAMESTGLPYIVSFTIEENGCLVDGTSISDAICYIDGVTERHPLCYMTNCVHPRIVAKALAQPFNRNRTVKERFRGIQANTAALSFSELDGISELKSSPPEAFVKEMLALKQIADIRIWGGCCGTDNRHMEVLARELTMNRKE